MTYICSCPVSLWSPKRAAALLSLSLCSPAVDHQCDTTIGRKAISHDERLLRVRKSKAKGAAYALVLRPCQLSPLTPNSSDKG
jgi:hypothetical protein